MMLEGLKKTTATLTAVATLATPCMNVLAAPHVYSDQYALSALYLDTEGVKV